MPVIRSRSAGRGVSRNQIFIEFTRDKLLKMRDWRDLGLFSLIALALYTLGGVRADSVEEVIAPNFESIDLQQNSQLIVDLFDTAILSASTNLNSSSASAIQNLQVLDFNDTSVLIQWEYDVSLSRHSFPSNLIVELADGKLCEDFYEIDNIPTAPTIALFQSQPIFSSRTGQSTLLSQSYLITSLQPSSNYRVRIVPVFLISEGRGFPSLPLVISTIASPINYWEQIFPRRTSQIWYGRGFSDPVTDRPHLSEGVEVYSEGTHFSGDWWTDAPTLNTPVFPSGRRGHSLSLLDNYVYMFGGRTNGYSCASTLIDTLDLGNSDSGLDIYPCVTMQAEINELWTFDISTYEWQFINTSTFDLPYNTSKPPPRELHSAAVVDGDLYIFGGKSRLHKIDATTGMPIMTNASDKVYNDLWKLEVDHLKVFEFPWTSSLSPTPSPSPSPSSPKLPLTISQGSRTATTLTVTADMVHNVYPNNPFINKNQEGRSPRNSQCIKDVMIEITFYHDCVNQTRFSLVTSGPVQGSRNYFPNNNHETEILLLHRIPTDNTTNCVSGEYTFIFHDSLNNKNDNLDRYYLNKLYPSSTSNYSRPDNTAPKSPPPTTLPYEDAKQCCFNGAQKVHYFHSEGLLSEIVDNSLVNQFTIIAEDLTIDSLRGELRQAKITLQSISCLMRYQWIPVITANTTPSASSLVLPPARYGANILTYNHSIFVFGGKNQHNQDLHDLYRYDLEKGGVGQTGHSWVKLTPVQFYENPLTSSNAIGSNFLLTSYGLLRYGGYYRQSYLKKMNPCHSITGDSGNSIGTGLGTDTGAISLEERCLFNEKHELLATTDVDSNYDTNVFIMDPITFKWRLLDVTLLSSSTTEELRRGATSANTAMTQGNNFFFYQTSYDQSIASNIPNNRYYSSMVFIPSNSLQWKQSQLQTNSTSSPAGFSYDVNERILYDNYQIASQGNYQSYAADSILLFGGFDAATGSMVDGSSGGFLQDTWMLRLNAFSTKSYRTTTLQYLSSHCQWRRNQSARRKFSTYSCLSSTTSTNCQLRDLMLLIWCGQFNQTMS